MAAPFVSKSEDDNFVDFSLLAGSAFFLSFCIALLRMSCFVLFRICFAKFGALDRIVDPHNKQHFTLPKY